MLGGKKGPIFIKMGERWSLEKPSSKNFIGTLFNQKAKTTLKGKLKRSEKGEGTKNKKLVNLNGGRPDRAEIPRQAVLEEEGRGRGYYCI